MSPEPSWPLKQNRTNDGSFFILHSPDVHEVYLDLSSRPQWKQIEELLNEKKLTVKDTDVSYRTINHWMSEKLLEDDRQRASGWRKLSLKDILWVTILRELRAFGLPLEKLRRTHETLMPSSSLWFEVGMALCLQTPAIPVFLVVFNDGSAEIATLRSLRVTDYAVGYDHPSIRINLNALCCEIFKNNRMMPPHAFSEAVFEAEREIILAAIGNKPDEAHLRFEGGVIKDITTIKKHDGKQKLVDLMRDIQFGEMTVKMEAGKPVVTTVTKKKKANK